MQRWWMKTGDILSVGRQAWNIRTSHNNGFRYVSYFFLTIFVTKISEVEVCYCYAEYMYSFPLSKIEKYPFNLFATKPELTLQRSWCGGRFLWGKAWKRPSSGRQTQTSTAIRGVLMEVPGLWFEVICSVQGHQNCNCGHHLGKKQKKFEITMLGDSEEKAPRLPTRVTFDRGLGDTQETS